MKKADIMDMDLLSNKGFTLIELMVTVSIVAIMASIAVPSYQSFVAQTRLTTQTNDLATALSQARSEAVKRGVRVTVCKTADPADPSPTCTTSGGWQQGWLVFVDNTHVTGNVAGTIDGSGAGADQRLRVFGALQGSTLSGGTESGGTGTNFENWISYLPSGRSRGNGGLANGSLKLCNAGKGRNIVVNISGRVSIVKVESC